MNDVLTISRPEMRAGRSELLPAVVVAVLLVATLVMISFSLRTPDMVSLTVDNPSEWRAEVSVRSADSTAWTGAGAVGREGSLEFLEFPDQGPDWVVRFTYAGYSDEVAVTRDQLVAQDWTVAVPAEFGELLAAEGVPPTTGSTKG